MSEQNNLKAEIYRDLLKIRTRHIQKMSALSNTAIIMARVEITDDKAIEKNIKRLKLSLKPYNLNTEQYFIGLLLFNLISEVELYFVDTVKAIVSRFPQKLGKIEFKFSEIAGRSEDGIIQEAASKFINNLMYKKPMEYLSELTDVISINKHSLIHKWGLFIEAKARRDLGIHNNWTVNEIYRRKVGEAGLKVDVSVGETICPGHDYLLATVDHCDAMIEEMSSLLDEKYGYKDIDEAIQ